MCSHGACLGDSDSKILDREGLEQALVKIKPSSNTTHSTLRQHCTCPTHPLSCPANSAHRAKACRPADLDKSRGPEMGTGSSLGVLSCKTSKISSYWKLPCQKSPKTHSKKRAFTTILVLAHLHHCTNKDSPSKTLTTNLIS